MSTLPKGRRFDPESLLAAPQRRITALELQRSNLEAPWDGVDIFRRKLDRLPCQSPHFAHSIPSTGYCGLVLVNDDESSHKQATHVSSRRSTSSFGASQITPTQAAPSAAGPASIAPSDRYVLRGSLTYRYAACCSSPNLHLVIVCNLPAGSLSLHLCGPQRADVDGSRAWHPKEPPTTAWLLAHLGKLQTLRVSLSACGTWTCTPPKQAFAAMQVPHSKGGARAPCNIT